jgi:PKD repeat protein
MKAFASLASAIALAAAAAGCTVHQTEQPPLTGPSDFALSLSVTTSPQTITQNGADSSVVTAKVFFTDPATGQSRPKANLPIRFDMQVNGVLQDYGTLSSRNAITGSDGVARTTYTAPPMPVGGSSGNGCNGVPGQCVTIVASTTDTTAATSSGATSSGFATIALTPPGVVLPPSGTPKAAFSFLPQGNITVGTSVTFDASASCPTDPSGNCSSSGSITSYSWTFGDGATGSGKTITHTYGVAGTYVATLTVTSDRGLAASTSQTIAVGLPLAPTADFVFSPTSPIAGQVVFFNADTSSSAAGHSIIQFNWNYGDGSTDVGMNVSHVYAQPGVYNVVLVIVDDSGQRATKATQVTVGNSNPVAKLNVIKAGGTSINADASLSTAVAGSSIIAYTFNFGDGTGNSAPSANPIVLHTYGVAGTYTVTVTVTDSAGRSGNASASITVP